MVNAFKSKIKEEKLNIEIRAQRAGCFDVCPLGPAIVVYPEGVFYGGVTPEDVPEIVSEHLIHDRPVERLKMKFK